MDYQRIAENIARYNQDAKAACYISHDLFGARTIPRLMNRFQAYIHNIWDVVY